MFLVSFVVPVYNLAEEELSACIASIARQTVSDYEIIIVDDGSSNGIGDYCDVLGKEYDAKIVHQSNQGLSAARNAGIKLAQGKWIVHVDGDDWIDDDLVECIKRIDSTTSADILVWGYVIKNGNRRKELLLTNKEAFDVEYESIKEKVLCAILDYDSSFSAIALNTSWGKAYRYEFIKQENLSYDSSLRRAQDVVYNLIAFHNAKRVDYIDRALNFYRTDNISLSRGYNPKTYEYLCLTAKAVDRFVTENKASAEVKEAANVFIERCFRMINVQLYQHKDNPLPYSKRRRLFMEGIESQPFKSAFSNSPFRKGVVNAVTDFLYKHKLFLGILLFDDLLGFAFNVKTRLEEIKGNSLN